MSRSLSFGVLSAIALSAALMADANYPTGTRGLLLIDKVGSYIRFFDPVTFKERSSVAVATKPHDFVLTADRKTAYVPLYGDGIYGRNPNPGHEVAIVDMDAGKVVGSIDIAPYRAPHGIQIDAERHDLRRQRSRSQAARHRPKGAQDHARHRHRGNDALDRHPAQRQQDLRDQQERRPVRQRDRSEEQEDGRRRFRCPAARGHRGVA